jgi:hypothetical protein
MKATTFENEGEAETLYSVNAAIKLYSSNYLFI